MKPQTMLIFVSLIGCQATDGDTAYAPTGSASQPLAHPGKVPVMVPPPWANRKPPAAEFGSSTRIFVSPENGMTGLTPDTYVTFGWSAETELADDAVSSAKNSVKLLEGDGSPVATSVVHQPPSGPQSPQRVTLVPSNPLADGWYTATVVSDGMPTPSLASNGRLHSVRFRVGSEPRVRQLRWCPSLGSLDVFMSEPVAAGDVLAVTGNAVPCASKLLPSTAPDEKGGASAQRTQFSFSCGSSAEQFDVKTRHDTISRTKADPNRKPDGECLWL